MKKILGILLAANLLAGSLFAQFDPATVHWNEVKSKAGWLNLYHETALLTLLVDNFPAFKKEKPIGYFSQTQFPFGQFNCEIMDSRTGKKIDQISAFIENGQSYSFVTFGSDKVKPVTILIHEKKEVETKKMSQITVYNGFPGGEMTWKVSADKTIPIPFGKSFSATFTTELGYKGTIHVRLEDGSDKSVNLIVAPDSEDANWDAFGHFDGLDFKSPQVSYLKEGFGIFSEAGEPSSVQ